MQAQKQKEKEQLEDGPAFHDSDSEDDVEVEEETTVAVAVGEVKEVKKEGEGEKSKWRLPLPSTSIPPLSETVKLNVFSDPDATAFQVRGPDYFNDKVKVASTPSVFKLAGLDLFLADEKIVHVAKRSDLFVQQLHQACQKRREKLPFVFVLNFTLPWGNFIAYFLAPNMAPTPLIGEPKFDKMLSAFINGDDEYRNSRWKLIPRMVEGNWVVKKAIGENTPAIIGKKLTHSYYKGPNNSYFEITCDVNSSKVGKAILGAVAAYTKKVLLFGRRFFVLLLTLVVLAKQVVIDLMFCIEPQEQEELPERILAGIRFHNLDTDAAPKLPATPARVHPSIIVNENKDSGNANGNGKKD